MNKTLADRLAKSPETRCEISKVCAAMLRRPVINHSEMPSPMIERFVFDPVDVQSVYDQARGYDQQGRDLLLEKFKCPLPQMWIEHGKWGFLLMDDTVTVFAMLTKKVTAIAFTSLDEIRQPGGITSFTELYSPGDNEWWHSWQNAVAAEFCIFGALCAIINSPRAATRERGMPGRGLTPEQKVARHRRMQRGYPLYSFNRMTLKRPETSRQSSDLLICGGQASKRGHWVIGHWRLIDNNPEPYWTWVEAHKRGDDEIGFVAHERHVSIEAGAFGLRRGFTIPTRPGDAGETIRASRD